MQYRGDKHEALRSEWRKQNENENDKIFSLGVESWMFDIANSYSVCAQVLFCDLPHILT